jgi:hypothetical protein
MKLAWAHLNGLLPISLPLVFMYVYPIIARQRLGKNVTAAANTRNSIIGCVVFYAVRVISKVGD